MNAPLHLLYAAGRPPDADCLRDCLVAAAPEIILETVDSGARCLERLRTGTFDALLLDLHLPDMEGMRVLQELAAAGLSLPVIIAVAVGDEPAAFAAIKLGACDYLVKQEGWLAGLGFRVQRAIEFHHLAQTNRRLQTEAAGQRRAEARLQAILDQAASLIYVVDAEGRFTLVNQRVADVLGRPREAILGQTRQAVLPPAIAEAHRANDQAVLRAGKPILFEETIEEPDGTHVYFSIKFPLLDPAGGGASVCGISTDITAQKRAEQALRESEERLRRIYEESPVGYQSSDAEGRLLDVNPAWLRLLGYTREEVIGRRLDEFFTPSSQADFAVRFPEFLRNGHTHGSEYELRRKDGAVLTVTFDGVFVRDAQGRPTHTHCLLHDITKRKAAEEALRQSESEYRLLFETNPNPMWIYDLETLRFLAVNEAAVSHYGYSPEEFLAMTLKDIRPEADVARLLDNIATHTEAVQHSGVWRHRRKSGEIILVEIASHALTWHGRAARVVLVHDVTRQRAAEAELEKARQSLLSVIEDLRAAEARVRQLNQELEQRVQQRTAQLEEANRELESFSYSVSHDLRAPLRHICGFVDLLRREAEPVLNETARRHLMIIADSAVEMGRLIDDLLAFSRVGRSELRRVKVDLNQLIKQAAEVVTPEAAGREIEWRIAPFPDVLADPEMLRLALVNLLANAVKYTRPRKPAIIEIGCQTQARELVCFVRDNGVGFDMRYADKLFGVFQRLHSAAEFEGTGIGLASVRRIIARHGGRTWAEGQVDVGATFYFSLPMPPAEAKAATSVQSPETGGCPAPASPG